MKRKMKRTMTFDLSKIGDISEDLLELSDAGYIPKLEGTLADFVVKGVKKVEVTFKEVRE